MRKELGEVVPFGGIQVAPLISVIAATRNHPAMLASALDAVRAQTFKGFDIIVVSYAEDASMRKASRQAAYMHRATFYELAGGDVLDAKLHGVNRATGEWITFLHEGDHWLPGHLSFQLALAHDKNADMVSMDDGRSILVKKVVFLKLFENYNRNNRFI